MIQMKQASTNMWSNVFVQNLILQLLHTPNATRFVFSIKTKKGWWSYRPQGIATHSMHVTKKSCQNARTGIRNRVDNEQRNLPQNLHGTHKAWCVSPILHPLSPSSTTPTWSLPASHPPPTRFDCLKWIFSQPFFCPVFDETSSDRHPFAPPSASTVPTPQVAHSSSRITKPSEAFAPFVAIWDRQHSLVWPAPASNQECQWILL